MGVTMVDHALEPPRLDWSFQAPHFQMLPDVSWGCCMLCLNWKNSGCAEALTLASQFPKDFPLLVVLGQWAGSEEILMGCFDVYSIVWTSPALTMTGTFMSLLADVVMICVILHELTRWHQCPNGWWVTRLITGSTRDQHCWKIVHTYEVDRAPSKTHWGTQKTDLEDWFWKMVIPYYPFPFSFGFHLSFLHGPGESERWGMPFLLARKLVGRSFAMVAFLGASRPGRGFCSSPGDSPLEWCFGKGWWSKSVVISNNYPVVWRELRSYVYPYFQLYTISRLYNR